LQFTPGAFQIGISFLNADVSKTKHSSRNFNANCYLFLSSQFSILINNYTVPINLTEVKPAGRGNPQVCDIEPLDQVTMEIVLRRKKKTRSPGTSSSLRRKLLGPPSAGAGPGAAPLPARLALSSLLGRAAPPRPGGCPTGGISVGQSLSCWA